MNRWLLAALVALVASGSTIAVIMALPGAPTPLAHCEGKFPLIRDDFSCDEYTQSNDVLTTLRATLENSVRQYQINRDASRISIWVRDLSTLQWVGINELEVYAPASLFKVPIMIAIFKYAEIQPDILSQKITFTPSELVAETDRVETKYRLKEGHEYTTEQLIEQMIRFSDNDAYALLVQRLSAEFLSTVYADLGLTVRPGVSATDEVVTARSYANVFRALYQSSYLTPEYSQKALTILTDTTFESGARGGVPKDVVIAHKFGLRRESDGTGTLKSLKFHDCGIVYLPERPYLFCILTDGFDEGKLQSIIATLSKDIYTSMNR